MARRNRDEELTHISFIEWCYANWQRWPWASIVVPRRIRMGRRTVEIQAKTLAFFHPPNGGARDAITGSKMHQLGTRRGILDLWLPVPSGAHCGLIIELKAPKKYPSKEQKVWIEFLHGVGWKVEVCRTVAECIDVTAAYLNTAKKNR